MKNGKKLVGLVVVAAGIASLAYVQWPKKKIPDSAIVEPFKEKYLGKWNKVARLPNLIAKDLRDFREEYTLNKD